MQDHHTTPINNTRFDFADIILFMPERNAKIALNVLRPIVETGIAGFTAGLLGGASVTLRSHRELTHKSVVLHPILQKVCDFEQRTVTIKTRNWAEVHRIHHKWPDVAAAPFSRIANGIRWIRENPDKAEGVKIPETYPNLDPFVPEFNLAQVVEIGDLITEYFRQRLKGYKPRESYTAEELKALLNPKQPTYWYSDQPHQGEYNQEEMEDILGGDPHSPARFSDSNGVRRELLHIPKVNEGASALFRAHPELMSEDLQSEDGQYKQYGKWDMALGFGIASAAVLVARGKYTPKDFLIAATQGSAINTIKIFLQLIGGNTVNSFGHAGSLTDREIIKIMRGQEANKIPVNPEGSISADTMRAGLIGRFLGWFTFDEVGGQKKHHDDPSKIAYTSEIGLKAHREAPWGSFISFLAQSKWVPFINPGPGFDLKEGERRPDEAHPAVGIINRIRAAQLVKDDSSLFSGRIS